MSQAALPELLTIAEVAEALRVHETTVGRWAKNGTLKPVRLAGTVRFRREDVERMLREAS